MKLKLFSVFIFLSFFISFLSAAPTEIENPLACDPPAKITSAASADGKILVVSPTVDDYTANYELEYRSGLDSTWIRYGKIGLNPNFPYIEITNLPTCVRYQVRIRKLCSPFSDWRTSDNYTLLPCPADCPKPATFTGVISSNDTIATFKWTLTSTVSNKAVLTISSDDGSFKKIINTTDNSIIINLPRCKKISAYLQVQCTNQLSESSAVFLETTGCTPPPPVCPKPTAFKVTGTDGSAIMSWQVPVGDSVNIIIAATDTAYKKVMTVGGSTYTLSGLPRCKHYIAHIQTKCSNSSVSDYAELVNFETTGCPPLVCGAVQQIGAGTLDNNAIVIKWLSSNATKYFVEYRLASDSLSGVWRRDSTTQTYFELKNLQNCLTYFVRVIAVCPNGLAAPSPVVTVKTSGCPVNTCHRPITFKGAVEDTTAYFGWATEIGENNLVLTVVSSDSTYNKITPVTGFSYTLTGLPHCKKFTATLQTKCLTGVLSDALEFEFTTGGCAANCGTPAQIAVVSADSTHAVIKWTSVGATKYYIEYKTDSSAVWKRDSTTATSFTLNNLIRCRLYLARVSAVCASGISYPTHTVHFVTSGCVVSTCKIPAGLDADIAHDTTVNFIWAGVDSGNYSIQYRVATDANVVWTTVKTTHPNYFLVGLKRCQVYVWQVRRICGIDTTAWSAPAKFETTGCAVGIGSAVCPKIQEIGVKFTVDTVVVYWASFSPRPFINYQIQYRKATDATWSAEINTTLPYYIFKNLSACTNYVVRVRVECESTGANFGDWAEVNFKKSGTNCLRGDNSGFTGSATAAQVSVSPNPSSENPTVVFKLEQQAPVRIDIANINGSVVSQWNAGILQAGDYAHTFEQLENLPTGLYFVALRIDGNATRTIKWLKN